MNVKLWSIIKYGFILFCVLFSITTIISSAGQLLYGRLTETNSHIISRAVVILIATITIILFERLKFKSKVLSHLVSYAISMSIVFLYVWITGFFEELHPNAYRDIFLNFTGATIVVSMIIAIKDRIKEKIMK